MRIMKTIKIIRRASPVQIEQPADRFGCIGFTSYGCLIEGSKIMQIKNPDFDWNISAERAAQIMAAE